MPSVALCQVIASSSSATETLKPCRNRSFMLRTTWRRSFSDRESGMESSTVRAAMAMGKGQEAGSLVAGSAVGKNGSICSRRGAPVKALTTTRQNTEAINAGKIASRRASTSGK
jgi:hypothetical protein